MFALEHLALAFREQLIRHPGQLTLIGEDAAINGFWRLLSFKREQGIFQDARRFVLFRPSGAIVVAGIPTGAFVTGNNGTDIIGAGRATVLALQRVEHPRARRDRSHALAIEATERAWLERPLQSGIRARI